MITHAPRFGAFLLGALLVPLAAAQVCNLKILTDASPDYSDMPSMIHSITSRWETAEQKCWALFYWNHIARRQTNPMHLHGLAVTDPIRQFNDFGHTMCSTVSGINCGIWNSMGLPSRYWDISNHTVSEVFYDGRWHMYDNSMSAIYTLCDGRTIAGVEDIGKSGSCEKSHGKSESGHIARYHCLTATSPNGFLTGADTIRSLEEEYRCFNPNGLKFRPYFYDQDLGHRYILNIRGNESYTRFYHSIGDAPGFYVPLSNKDPEALNKRYRLRGNGKWVFTPDLTPAALEKSLHSASNVIADADGTIHPAAAGVTAAATFKVSAANIITSYSVSATVSTKTREDRVRLLTSGDNGKNWLDASEFFYVTPGKSGEDLQYAFAWPGDYELLLKFEMLAKNAPTDASLRNVRIETVTQLNSKTQPRLNLGRNTVYVGAGDQSESIVLWPELQNDRYKPGVVAEHNVESVKKHSGYMGAVHPAKAGEDAYVVYKLDAPREITRLGFGGRFYNRAPGSHIDLLYSLDGQVWKKSWSLTKTDMPWDVVHYETAEVPPGHRSVWVKYLMNTTDPSPSGCSIYAVRMEAGYKPADPGFKPLEVTFRWQERQADYSLVDRAHTQLVEHVPFTYTINVGGADHPVMQSLGLSGNRPESKYGYADQRDAGGDKFIHSKQTLGRNLAVGKPYTLSAPSETTWEAGDPDLKKLTDGVVGPPYAGGTSYRSGAVWSPKKNPVITLDLGSAQACASFGLNFHGYPFHDALKGQIDDKVQVLVSDDGAAYRPLGHLKTGVRWKDLPVNYMWTDEETMTGATFRLVPDAPVTTRYVQYKVINPRHFCATELEVLDSMKSEPFDLKLALPVK